MRLNRDQQLAVSTRGHTVVVACPGSGKTRILIERTARILDEDPDAPLIIVTFTRQAASELASRLSQRLASLSSVRVATFHSLALQQLLLGDASRICGPSDQLALLRLAARQYISDDSFSGFVAAAEAVSSGHSSHFDQPNFQLAYDTYLELLADHSAIDFGQAILVSASSMEEGSIRPLPCRYLLVDEVQDIDPVQVRWVCAHTAAGAELTVVGDDDQSIYGWRYALGYAGMVDLRRRHRATLIALSTNYRSRTEVLGIASLVISKNVNRVPKALYSARGPGGSVHLRSQLWTETDEAAAVLQAVTADTSPWAIIARTNRKLDFIASCLREAKVPFSRPGKKRFWDLDDPSLMVRALRPDGLRDPLTLSSLRARVLSPESGSDPVALLARSLRDAPLDGDPARRIDIVAKWLSDHQDGFSESRKASSREIIDSARKTLLGMSGSLLQRLEILSRPLSSKNERITLLTMHGSKGLEYPKVWIFGCQDGVIPNSKCPDIEEERRLMYVAMTRAEDELHISFAWNQLIARADGTTHLRRLTPSRFLSVDMGLPIPKRSAVVPEQFPLSRPLNSAASSPETS